MRPETQKRFLALLDRQEREIMAASAEWVYGEAVDLQGKRPKHETDQLIAGAFAAYKTYLLTGDYEPLGKFIRHVVDFRGDMMFRLSTPERGMITFKRFVGPRVRAATELSAEEKEEVLAALDEAFERALFDLSDSY